MTYREGGDALRPRVTQLERELEDTKANVPGARLAAAGALRLLTARYSTRGLTIVDGVFETVLQLADRCAVRAPEARVAIAETVDEEDAKAGHGVRERDAHQS